MSQGENADFKLKVLEKHNLTQNDCTIPHFDKNNVHYYLKYWNRKNEVQQQQHLQRKQELIILLLYWSLVKGVLAYTVCPLLTLLRPSRL